MKKFAMSPLLKKAVGVAIIVLTITIFVYFFIKHPDYIRNLRHVRPIVIVEVIALNALLTLVLTMTYDFTLRLCGHRLPFKENFLLTAYSSIANFFGPLQSGPGVRAVYLKTKHNVRMRDYTLATLIGYAMFAMLSALFLFGGSLVWWAATLVFAGVAAFCFFVIRYFMKRSSAGAQKSALQLRPQILAGLLLCSVATVIIVTSYYFIELRAVNPHISLHQAIIYSGAANFALFVSLTPDAIGIRESFLVLTRRLHHIPTAVILTANIIDRGAYLIYLGILFAFVLLVHASDRLHLHSAEETATSE
jgi:uncharacterized membrane protein YbhN (UPF0104 family)